MQGLELVDESNWYTHFRSDISVGNFGAPLKTLRLKLVKIYCHVAVVDTFNSVLS